MIAVSHEGEFISVYPSSMGQIILSRETNTTLIELEQDEVLALIAELAKQSHMGKITLVVEKEMIFPRTVFEDENE